MKVLHSRKRKSKYAQTLVEIEIILPVMLLVLIGIFELARLMQAWLAIENGARCAASQAASRKYDPIDCPQEGCFDKDSTQLARLSAIHQAAWECTSSIHRMEEGTGNPIEASYFKTTVCPLENLMHPNDSDQSDTYRCLPKESAGDPTDRIAIVIEFNQPLMLSSFIPGCSYLRVTSIRKVSLPER